jgi:phosphoenolpyruvate carboxylase
MPFRGHLSPDNLEGFLDEYKGIYTVTIQSALKYDHPLEDVKRVVEFLNEKLPYKEAALIDASEEKLLLQVLEKFKAKYQEVVEGLGPLINHVASYIPSRRARKLHIGLFGYSREVGETVLPRAIPFAAALYSLGIPPEFVGCEVLDNLGEEEWDTLQKYYTNIERDLNKVAGYVCWQNVETLTDMYKSVARKAGMEEERLRSALTKFSLDLHTAQQNFDIKLGPRNLAERKYENTVSNFLISYLEGEDEEAKGYLKEAARIRKCLG